MNLTSHGHSSVSLAAPHGRLVVDPGVLSDLGDLGGAAAILITHGHGDHVDIEAVAAAARDGGPLVHAPEDVVDALVAAGAPRERLTVAVPGAVLDLAGLRVEVVALEHAVIHSELPSPPNVGYLFDGRVLHPGDSLEIPESDLDVDVLLLPVAAPWGSLGEAIDFARALAPRLVVPIHDAILSDAGKAVADGLLGAVATWEYRRLAAGEATDLGPAGGDG